MNYKKQNRPKCGCGNSQDPNGYCDGSHSNN
jgi:CDGSH-type Zn-finger protein